MASAADSPLSPLFPRAGRGGSEPTVHCLFEKSTDTWTWLVADPTTKDAVIIDPFLDGRSPTNPCGISTAAADRLLDLVLQHRYRCVRILETRAQRRHATAAWYLRVQLRDRTGCMPRICAGKSVEGIERLFQRQYRIHDPFSPALFNDDFRDGDGFDVGNLWCQVVRLGGPGDPDRLGFVIGKNVFTGSVDGEMAGSPDVRALKQLSALPEGYIFHPQDSTLDSALVADVW